MHKFKLLFFLIFIQTVTIGQKSNGQEGGTNYTSDRDAKYAVSQILFFCGLEPNFTVVIDFHIPNAQAYIHRKKRYIKYNPEFMNRIIDSTNTDWAAWSVLAHEIGHHLLGHTVEKYNFSHENELSADHFSGFILHKMGATIEESVACINKEGKLHGSKTHPPLEDRINAITKGWNQSAEINNENTKVNSLNNLENEYLNEVFTHLLKFNGDESSYYVNEVHQIIWYDNYGNAILLSSLKDHDGKSFRWDFVFDKSLYRIDYSGKIWLIAAHGATILVGKTEPIDQ